MTIVAVDTDYIESEKKIFLSETAPLSRECPGELNGVQHRETFKLSCHDNRQHLATYILQ